jgi:hypothetical protein
VHRLTLAAAAALVLAAGACATPPAEKSAAGGSAESHAKDRGAKDEKAKGKKPSWWQRLSKYHREPKEKPWAYGDVRPGRGVLSNDDDGFVLYRQGEGQSSGPGKPTKVKR